MMAQVAPWWMPIPMTHWGVPLIAAALTIPPLIALYFLKLKRKQVPVPSTLLWRRAVQDLQVNAPFQRLRRNLLLLLQLLILIAAILALWRPTFHVQKSPEKTTILLVDQSASMATRESDGQTRLEHAKQQAKLLIDDMGRDDRAMVIAFSDQARIIAPFGDDKSSLKRQIDSVEQTEGLSRLKEAFRLAEAYATPIGEGIGTPDNPVPPAHMVLLSDGRIEDTDKLVLRRGSLELVLIGQRSDNLAITAMDVRRHYEEPELLTVMVGLANFSDRSASSDVSLYIDSDLIGVLEATWHLSVLDWLSRQEAQEQVAEQLRAAVEAGVAAGELTAQAGPNAAREYLAQTSPRLAERCRSLLDRIEQDKTLLRVFELEHAGGGILEVRLSGRDALDADNRAWAVLQPSRRVSVLLVTDGNYFLNQALTALHLGKLERMGPAEYEAAQQSGLVEQGRSRYDVVIFDGHSTAKLAPGAYLFFASIPEIEGVGIEGVVADEYIVDWDDSHPVLRHVLLDYVHVVKWARLRLPERAEMLIEGQTSPVMSYLSRDGRQYLLVAFSLLNDERTGMNTNWPLRPSFPVFTYNALQFLAAGVSAGAAKPLKPGGAITVPVAPGTKSIVVRRPDGSTDEVTPAGTAAAHYGKTRQIGLYRVKASGPGGGIYAVNLFDETESDISPNASFKVGSEQVATTSAARQRVGRSLWPWLLGLALLTLFVEWYIYNRRVFV